MKITLVKKIRTDGSPCKKCQEVIARLEESGQILQIDQILIADEGDADSPGNLLAKELSVDRAPFFVVDHDDGRRDVYTVYFKFVKEILKQKTSEQEELAEIMHNNPGLDFI